MMEPGARPTPRENVRLAEYTTIGLGGPARYFAECTSEDEIREGLRFGREHGLRVLILGGGSNLLIPDAGWDGLVLRVRPRGVEFDGASRVHAMAGEDWDEPVAACVARGLAGLECLSGIPGFVGGTPIQNVGAYGQEVAERIESVRVLERETGAIREIPGAQCGFAYRMSRFKRADAGRFVVTAVEFRLDPDGPGEPRYEELRKVLADLEPGEKKIPPAARLAAIRAAVLGLRRGKSMVFDPADPNSRSLGSFFMNPVLSPDRFAGFRARLAAAGIAQDPPRFASEGGIKIPAAWLIERAGFARGFRSGGVGISEKHALALVNHDGSTAELLELAERIQSVIREKFGIDIQREPVFAE